MQAPPTLVVNFKDKGKVINIECGIEEPLLYERWSHPYSIINEFIVNTESNSEFAQIFRKNSSVFTIIDPLIS